MVIAQGKCVVTKGDVKVETKSTVLLEADGTVTVLVEAPDDAIGPEGTWQLVDGEAETLTVADCSDDLEITFARSGSTSADVLKLAGKS